MVGSETLVAAATLTEGLIDTDGTSVVGDQVYARSRVGWSVTCLRPNMKLLLLFIF